MYIDKKEKIKYDKSFAEYFKIKNFERDDDFLIDENIFCKRLIKILHRNNIFSFNDLLNTNIAHLLIQRDIGKVKFKELLDCIKKVLNNSIDIKAIQISQERNIPYPVTANRKDILNGNLSCLINYPELYEKYISAYDLLGSEMIRYCISDKSNKIILCLNEFAQKNHLKSERKIRIEKVITSIPEIRKHKNANQFIDVYCSYSNNYADDYAILKTAFSNGKLTLSSKQIEDIVDNDTYFSVINFITWVSFSVEHTQNVIMKSILDNSFKRKVLAKRAQNKSFKIISEELNCKKEMVISAERKIIQDFCDHKYQKMLFDFILIDINIPKIEQLKLSKLVQILDYEAATKLLFLIRRSLKNKYHQ